MDVYRVVQHGGGCAHVAQGPIESSNRELFEVNGGERLSYIPALNDDPAHIEMLAGLVERELQGWL